MDIDLSSMIGEDFPKMIRLPGRKLQSKKHAARKAYNITNIYIKQHRLIEKYEALITDSQHMSEQERQVATDKLDRIKKECMLGSGKRCRKIRHGKIPCSTKVSMWLQRKRVFEWILRHLTKPLKDLRNLYSKCCVMSKSSTFPVKVKQPNEYTANQVRARLIAIKEQLVVIESEAPEMRSRHFRRMKEDAESKGQEKRVARIKAVIKREESAGCHRNVGLTTKKRKGGGKVFKVQVENHTFEASLGK
jgi:hypothetical protein